MKKKLRYKTLEDITRTIKQRKKEKKFDYYLGDTHDICVIHLKFGDMRKCYINLSSLDDQFFINEFDKYWSYEESYFKEPKEILDYIRDKNLPVILYQNATDSEISISEAYKYFLIER